MKAAFVYSILPLVASAALVANNAKVAYDGWQVLRVKDTPKLAAVIEKEGLDVWNGAPGSQEYVDVAVPPAFTGLDSFETSVMHEDLGPAIRKETDFAAYRAGSANISWFNSYHSYDTHIQWIKDLQASNSNNSEVITVGNSAQGRPITAIHFWGASGKNAKPAVVLHSTVHAREWITTMTNEYFAWSMLSNYTTDASIKTLLDRYDYYVFPVVNPDGFSYSQTNQRLWRKNRVPNPGSTCAGTDLNRNWSWKWEVPGGASTDPCDETYKGTVGFSAPETTALSNFLKKAGNSTQGLQLFVDVHAYSQLFMTPYGYSCTALPANNALYQRLASGVGAAIRAVYGTTYTTGPICSTIYQATGNSVDYAADVAKAKFAFTSELRDTGRFGFVLPPNQILPTGIESFAGFKYLLANMP